MAKPRKRRYENRTYENRCPTCGNPRDELGICDNPFCPLGGVETKKRPYLY